MKRINIDYHHDYHDNLNNRSNLNSSSSSNYHSNINYPYGYSTANRSKNDKNWENWERIREQKLEKMKNICFESYRRSKRDKMQPIKPKPKQLDPSWYTDNIYSNRSEDLEEDYVPDCLKYSTYRKLRNISEQDEFFTADDSLDESAEQSRERRGEGEGSSASYGLHRSTSCKEFQYPKANNWLLDDNVFEAGGPQPVSILKNRSQVPKSYSFTASSKTMPFDEMDFVIPTIYGSRREKHEAFRKSSGYFYSNSLDETALSHTHEPHSCCAREHCTNAKCLLEEIYPTTVYSRQAEANWRRGLSPGLYGAGAGGGSNRNLHLTTPSDDWLDEPNAQCSSLSNSNHSHSRNHRMAAASRCSIHSACERPPPPPPTVICCCAADDCCCRRRQQHLMATRSVSRLHCPGHHPAAEEEEHMHCRASAYDTDLDHFIRDERERLMMQDKFLDEDERYLSACGRDPMYTSSYRSNQRSKMMLNLPTPSRYDEDNCSETTEMDLEDFNIDLEKYWEELEKPPSPIDIDMQRRNMRSNLKVKNVNVGCYNNGQPIDLHDREQERMFIKKSLLEGMPSPPQPTHPHAPNNSTSFHYFDHSGAPLDPHSSYNPYGHKVYPSADTLPTYKYNNFYPEQTVQTQQPQAGSHHPSASGNSALSLINNIFSIYKPNKYSPLNCQMNIDSKPEPCKKMNVPSTRRPLGAPHSEYMHSMKRPLIVSAEQPHFKIIPEKTGLKISPLYQYDDFGDKIQTPHKFTSTARPLLLPH